MLDEIAGGPHDHAMTDEGGFAIRPRAAVIDDFLPTDVHDELLHHVLDSKDQFRPARIHRDGQHLYDDTLRRCLHLYDLGPAELRLREALETVAETVSQTCGVTLPRSWSLELELSAYGEASHFGRHTDIPIGPKRISLGAEPGQDRIVSAVYYLHRLPRGFAGGELRLFAWGDEAANDIDAKDNRLIAFPSWAEHQVLPVQCASDRFEDSRFALNCWYCARLD